MRVSETGRSGTAEATSVARVSSFDTARTDAGERTAWNQAVQALDGSLLQSWGWGELHERHGFRVERFKVVRPEGEALAQVLFRHRGPVSVAYLPRGPVTGGDAGRAVTEVFIAIDAACKHHRALGLTVEPESTWLSEWAETVRLASGGRRWHHRRTIMVPLLSDDDLLGQMRSETRRKIRRAQRDGVLVERAPPTPVNVDRFYALLRETANRNAFHIEPYAHYNDVLDVFGDDAVLLFARVEDRPVVGVIAIAFGAEAVDMFSASSTAYRVRGAADLLRFEAMRWAREKGCSRYNLWGIPADAPRPTLDGEGQASHGDDWRGLYHFKVGFGGHSVMYPHTIERRYHPTLLRLARRIS